jgi:hypothetical protein
MDERLAAELRPGSLTCRRRGRGWSPRPATPGVSGVGSRTGAGMLSQTVSDVVTVT